MMLKLYADGSSTGKVGEGGWAFVILEGDKQVLELAGGALDTTNNRMELSGVIEGLRYIYSNYRSDTSITVYSDSQYVIRGITEWFPKWERGIEKGKKIKNQDLWIEYKQLVDLFTDIGFEWVKGHSGVESNERCDYLAKEAKLAIKNRQLEDVGGLLKAACTWLTSLEDPTTASTADVLASATHTQKRKRKRQHS